MIIKWLQDHIPASVGVAAVAALSFIAGQVVPSYFDYAADERASVAALIDQVELRGDALEKAIAPVMVAAMSKGSSESAVTDLNDRVLDLFQAVEYVQREFPQIVDERDVYIASLVRLREVTSTVAGPLDAPKFVEAASEFKHARTIYEARVAELEPSFFTSLTRGLD